MHPFIAKFTLFTLVLSNMAFAETADRDREIVTESGHDCKTLPRDPKNPGQQVLVCSPDVSIVQGTLSAFGDSLTIIQTSSGSQSFEMTGNPIKFRQKLDGDGGWMDARGMKMTFSSEANEAHLTGDAWVKTDRYEFTGAEVIYNTSTEEIAVTGGSDAKPAGRVHVVVQPKHTTTKDDR